MEKTCRPGLPARGLPLRRQISVESSHHPLLRDFALIAIAAVLGWWTHTVDETVRGAIAQVLDTNVTVRVDSYLNLHGSVVLTAWTKQHSIQIALRLGERTA